MAVGEYKKNSPQTITKQPSLDFAFLNTLKNRVGAKLRKCMVRRRTARGLKKFERIVRVNVSGLFVENRSPGT